MTCNFSVPLSSAGIAPAISEPFAYSVMTCDAPTYTAITEPTGTRTFDFSNSVTSGDMLVAGFLSMMLILTIAWSIYQLTFRRKY